MVHKDFEHSDPMELVGHSYEITSQTEHDRDAARTFIEEFALMGWQPDQIRGLFASPQYTACHSIRDRQGDRFVDELIDGVFGVTSR